MSVECIAAGWMVGESNPGGGRDFSTCLDRPWDPPCLLYKGYRVFFRVKRPEHGFEYPSPSNTEVNPLTPNDDYSGRTAPLTSKRCILYIYPTNIDTEYFKHGIYSPFLSLQNAVCFIILTYLVPVLFTFYIQSVLKLKKKIIPAPNG